MKTPSPLAKLEPKVTLFFIGTFVISCGGATHKIDLFWVVWLYELLKQFMNFFIESCRFCKTFFPLKTRTGNLCYYSL